MSDVIDITKFRKQIQDKKEAADAASSIPDEKVLVAVLMDVIEEHVEYIKMVNSNVLILAAQVEALSEILVTNKMTTRDKLALIRQDIIRRHSSDD